MINLYDRFVFRRILPDEAEEAADLEYICFPPNEACSREMIMERVSLVPDGFLVAYDKDLGIIAGLLTGIATNESYFRDEFFKDASLHDPQGSSVMLLGLEVRPEYRHMGIARELMRLYAEKEAQRGRKRLVLTCLDKLITMYKQFGFTDIGISASVWGGETWHDMEMVIN